MAENPKVFISYSHDSPEHKQWVSELAARLRRNGVDAILDQWDLGLGDDVTRFMERGIVGSDRVLVICTDKYVSKANAEEGGVGYERMIVNAELVQNLGTDKFIPIIRQASGKEKTPTFLGTRVYADFTNDSQFDAECEKLIRELHEMPLEMKPPLGRNPFPSIELDSQLTDIPEQVESASEAYKTATKLIRVGDIFGWRELIKNIRPNVFKSLVQWRQDELEGQKSKSENPFQIMDKAVDIISPLMVVALAGTESGKEGFKKQKSFLGDLFNVVGWDSTGYTAWVRIPYALGYVYHSLHGCVSMNTNHLEIAFNLALIQVPNVDTIKHPPIWRWRELMGWCELFPNCIDAWHYLARGFERWEWLSLIFGTDVEYQSSLVAYYMMLNIHELAALIASDKKSKLNNNYNIKFSSHLCVPPTFMSENKDIYKQAQLLLLRDPDVVIELWEKLNVTHEQMQNSWREWVSSIEHWWDNVHGRSSDVDMRTVYKNVNRHRNFFDMLQP